MIITESRGFKTPLVVEFWELGDGAQLATINHHLSNVKIESDAIAVINNVCPMLSC